MSLTLLYHEPILRRGSESCRLRLNRIHASREEALIEWVKKNGGRVESAVEIQRSETEESCQVFYDGDKDPRELGEMIGKIPEEFWAAKLALKLVLEMLRGGRSQFLSYLDTLPVGVPGSPIFFTPSAVQALDYPPLIDQINKRCQWLLGVSDEDREKLKKVSRGVEFTPDSKLLGWALAMVASRAFRLRQDRPSLLPLIDICNHSFTHNCEVMTSTKDKETVELVTTQDVKEGSSLMLNYGNLSNDDFLLDYGFFIPDNPYDFVEIKFAPDMIFAARDFTSTPSASSNGSDRSQRSGLVQWQQSMLEDLNLSGARADIRIKIKREGEIIDPRLLAGVRVLLSNSILKVKTLEELKVVDGEFPVELEKQTYRAIGTLLYLLLNQFTTSVEEDEKKLQEGSFQDANEKLSVEFRISKKRLLLNATKFVSEKILKTV